MKTINQFFLFSLILLISFIFSNFVLAEAATKELPALTQAPQGGPPLLPMTVIGKESAVNGKLCSNETIIEAVIDGKVRTTRNCNAEGKYTLAIVGTADDAGKEILFFVDGAILQNKDTWASGKIIADFSFAITRELNQKELQKIAEEEQKKQQQELEEQQKEKQRKIITGIIIAVMLIFILLIVYYVIRKQTKQKVYKESDNVISSNIRKIKKK
ncbi:hypothetical protein HZA96_04900 [Candidatus Woesearchaeota archaeon]|nr:hypothetical protein [Candidatus Woesearchaeota archaeon]